MKKVLRSALAAGALTIAAAGPALAGQVYGNYGQTNAPQTYGAPAYGPGYGGPYRAGPPAYAWLKALPRATKTSTSSTFSARIPRSWWLWETAR